MLSSTLLCVWARSSRVPFRVSQRQGQLSGGGELVLGHHRLEGTLLHRQAFEMLCVLRVFLFGGICVLPVIGLCPA